MALTILAHATAADATSMPPSWMPMTMLVVSFDAVAQRLDVQDQAAAVLLAYDTDAMGRPDPTATAFGEYDPAQPWAVLQDSAFSRQLGWWAGTGSAPALLQSSIESVYGTDASIWIESLSQSTGLETYLAIGRYGVSSDNTMTVDPAAHAYTGIFGTDGSSTRWNWDYQMDHNTYAVPWAHLAPDAQFTATYRVYVGDAFGNELAAATGASTLETWTWKAPAVMPVPEPTTFALMMAGLGVLGCATRRRNAQSSL